MWYEKCHSCTNNLEKSIQKKKLKGLKFQGTPNSSSNKFEIITQLKNDINILEDEKAFLESFLGDCEADLDDLQVGVDVDTHKFKHLE